MSSYLHNKRKQRDNDEGHIDDWLMTYADMITLLLCFFAVFLAISIPEERKFEEAKKKVTETFTGDKLAPGQQQDFMKGMFPLPATDKDTPPQADIPNKALPSIVDRFNKNENVEVEKGDRITTIEMNSGAFFEKGSAIIGEEGINILKEFAPNLLTAEYKDYTISIEGYTDDIPIKTVQYPSNWELSSARAASVVRALIDLGVPSDRMRAVGFADASPKVPNRDADGKPIPENQAQNRRVVVRLEKIVKQKTDNQ